MPVLSQRRIGDDGIEGDAGVAVAGLTAAVDALLGLPVTSLPGVGLIGLARLVEVQARRLPAFDHVLVAALASSGVCAEVGARNTAAVLVQALRVSPGEAAGRVRAAKQLGPRVDVTAGPMPPRYPEVAAAQADGEISVAHARAVTTTLTLDQLETRLGVATTSPGGLITIPAALRLAADADIIPVVPGDGTGILAHGRSKRHATTKHRRVLAARDRGCSFPGCDAPPQWTQTHHIIAWAHGGHTDLTNTTLLCGYHHRTHETQGWECQMINGTPHWLPPWWPDPTRTPIRNQTHHVADYLCDQAA